METKIIKDITGVQEIQIPHDNERDVLLQIEGSGDVTVSSKLLSECQQYFLVSQHSLDSGPAQIKIPAPVRVIKVEPSESISFFARYGRYGR